MFGLDDRIAGLSNGATLLVVVAVSILLGLRHALDARLMVAIISRLPDRAA